MTLRTLMPLAAVMIAAYSANAASPPAQISPQRMSADVKILASDAFEGRAPGSKGELKTIAWLTARLKAMGLEPAGPGGKWTQDVPLVRTKVGEGTIRIGSTDLTQREGIYVSTLRPDARVQISNAPLVFVGYGVTAPERGWDDFKGVDLKGKVAVMLVNDPDFEAAAGEDSSGKFGGKAMTFYGRWVYKYEEAARQGAIAALIIHDTPGAGYGWNTVIAPQGENFDLAGSKGRLAMQGWLEGAAAGRLFADAGLNLAALRMQARRADFRPVVLKGQTLSADLPVTSEKIASHNVLAKIRGAKRPDEYVSYGAHWDAYGIGAPDAQGRTIRPGANDDALGVAGLLEIARAFKAAPRPDRSILFGFWTAEERGLLGSEAYARAPTVPMNKTIANIGLDILNTGGPARDVLLVGVGQNSLEQDLSAAAKIQGRTVTPESLPERGLFYRADHFSFAKRGVPTLLFMAISGTQDLVNGGTAAGQKWLDDYMRCYHQACDAWSKDWDLRGAAQDVTLAYQVGKKTSKAGANPTWSETSEFRAVREKDLKGKK
nr:M28 family metallopeptidase [uncultured Sphingomonas sp.]